MAIEKPSENLTVSSHTAEHIEAAGQNEIDMLLAELGSDYETLRNQAATLLSKLGEPTTVRLLIKALDDNDPRMRLLAMAQLKKLGHQ